MNSISEEEYLKMIQEAQESPFDEDSEPKPEIDESSWIPSVSPVKDSMMERLRRATVHGKIDVSKLRKDQIQDALYKCVNVVIGDFVLHINEYHGYPGKNKTDLSMDISILCTQYKTITGAPCKMELRFDPSKDNRFNNKPWSKRFDAYGHANYVPVEIVVDIVRWFQALKRLPSFL